MDFNNKKNDAYKDAMLAEGMRMAQSFETAGFVGPNDAEEEEMA